MMAADKANEYSCDRVVPIEQEPRHHLVFENEFVRAFAVEIGPRVRTLCHHHPNDYLLYVAGGAEIISAARDEEPKQLNYSEGECELLSAGLVHVVDNLGDTVFRNVVVELLPGADQLRRGGDPKVIRGGAKIVRILNDERAAVFGVEIEPGAEVEVSGPMVLASLKGHNLLDFVADINVKSNVFCDLAWISPGRTGLPRGYGKTPERVIVFQVGRVGD
jgi:hypothetical protein